MVAFMITKQRGLERAIYFLENKKTHTPLGMFYQESKTEAKSSPALFGISAAFDFGLCIWQRLWRLWRKSSEDQPE